MVACVCVGAGSERVVKSFLNIFKTTTVSFQLVLITGYSY